MTAIWLYLLSAVISSIVLTAAGLLWAKWRARRAEVKRFPWRRKR